MKSKVSKLLLSEMRRGRIVLFTIAQIIGVAIISVSLLLYFDLTSTVSGGVGSDYLVVTKPVSMVGDLFSKGDNGGFSPYEVENIESQNGIQSVGEFTASHFRSRASFGLGGGGGNIYTEMFFESVDSTYLDIVPEEWGFDPEAGEVPIIIPQNYLNLYNFGFAPSAGLPRLSKGLIERITMGITLYSHSGTEELRGRIVGFTTRLNTILVPEGFIKWGNLHYGSGNSEEVLPQRLILRFDAARSTEVANFIADEGYEIESNGFDFERISRLTTFLLLSTLLIGAIITLLSISLLILTLYLMVERNRGKITTLSIIGYNTSKISRPLTALALRVTTISFVGAYAIALIVRSIYLSTLSDLLQRGGTLSALIVPTLIIAALYITIVILSQLMVRRQIGRFII